LTVSSFQKGRENKGTRPFKLWRARLALFHDNFLEKILIFPKEELRIAHVPHIQGHKNWNRYELPIRTETIASSRY